MRTHLTCLARVSCAALIFLTSCRSSIEDKAPEEPVATEAAVTPKLIDDPSRPVLQKVVGALTRDYPENRFEVCNVLASDITNLEEVKTAIASVQSQSLQDGLILTAVVPSIQYFGYIGGEQVLLSEISDKRRTRAPESGQGNPSFDLLMEVLNTKCGAKDGRP